MPAKKQEILICGAGLTGSLVAIYMAKRGFKVDICEGRPDMRQEEISAGRSINLALSERGIKALKDVGVYSSIAEHTIPMHGRLIHPVEGEKSLLNYSQHEHEAIFSMSRGLLNQILMSEAEKTGNVQIHFNHKCVAVNSRTGVASIEHGGKTSEWRAELIIGADGANSEVRHSLLRNRFFNYSQEYLTHGYKELTIPADRAGGHHLEKNALHIWPRGGFMLIALPNTDGSFTCTLFFPMRGKTSFESIRNATDLTNLFSANFADALPLMPSLTDDFFGNPTGTLITVKCFPWSADARVVLIGDACHALVPFYGQGMNCGFEDCRVFDDCIEAHAPDWQKVFSVFERVRKPNADSIADMALANYIEMRDSVAHDDFKLRKEASWILEREFPQQFIPNYSMVSFTNIPYAIAMHRAAIQDQILDELCEGHTSVEMIDLAKAAALIDNRLSVVESTETLNELSAALEQYGLAKF